jgi:NADP-dependent 3-hydroxy acid dehydrogenase YdfG
MSKTIAIIGAGPGIGLAIAQRFGREGFNVALLGRNQERLDGLVDSLKNEGVVAASFIADVMDRPGLASALQQVIDHYGSIDVLEYGPAPAMDKMRSVLDTEVEAANYQFEFNVLGAITAVQAVLPGMRARQSGTILFTTAVSAQHPLNITASFGIAAGAQLNYARLLHNNLKEENIYVGSVSIAALVAADEASGKILAAHFPPGLPIIKPKDVSDVHWALFTGRGKCEAIVGDFEALQATPGFQR